MNCRPEIQHETSKRRRAFSLVEMLVSVGVGSLILMATALLSVYGNQSFVCVGNYLDLDRVSRAALDQMTRDARQAVSLASYSTNQLVFSDCDSNQLNFYWNPATKLLTRTQKIGATTATTTLLTQCDFLSFRIYQRNPIPGQFNFYPATNASGVYVPGLCKLIDVSWRCSRTVLGNAINTESVQTAKICLRN